MTVLIKILARLTELATAINQCWEAWHPLVQHLQPLLHHAHQWFA